MTRLDREILDDNYELRLDFVAKLKKSISYRLFLIKLILITIMFVLILVPNYFILILFLKFLNVEYLYNYHSILNNVPYLYYLFCLWVLYKMIKGSYPYPLRYFFFYDGLLALLIFDSDYLFWIFKFIGLYILLELPLIVEKFAHNLKNYSYSENYSELLALKNAFDSITTAFIKVILLLLSVSYIIMIVFYLITIKIGLEIAIILPLIFLPILTIVLFLSPEIFTSVKKFTLLKDK